MTTHVRRIAAVAGLAAIAIAALWYFALWSPQSHKLTSAHQAQAAAETQITNLNGQIAQLQTLLKQIPTDQTKLAVLEADLPNNPSFDTALKQLHDTAIATGVTITNVGPSVPAGAAGTQQGQSATTAGAPAVTVSISATAASEAQLEAFVGQLTNLSQTHRVFVVDHLQFGGTSGPLSVTITARIFYAGQPTP